MLPFSLHYTRNFRNKWHCCLEKCITYKYSYLISFYKLQCLQYYNYTLTLQDLFEGKSQFKFGTVHFFFLLCFFFVKVITNIFLINDIDQGCKIVAWLALITVYLIIYYVNKHKLDYVHNYQKSLLWCIFLYLLSLLHLVPLWGWWSD